MRKERATNETDESYAQRLREHKGYMKNYLRGGYAVKYEQANREARRAKRKT